MTDKRIVMFRVKDRSHYDETIQAKSIFDAHLYHALDHDDNLLFVSKGARVNVQHSLSSFIFALSEEEQLIGDVVAFGSYAKKAPTLPDTYSAPSQWENEIKQHGKARDYCWYELKNVRRLDKCFRDKLRYYKTDESFSEVFSNKNKVRTRIPLYFRIKGDE